MHPRLSIGRVAKLYGISHDALRLYDAKGLLKPIIDPQTGYRSYTLAHLSVLDMILLGKTLGMPLARLRETFDSQDPAEHARLLRDQLDTVHAQIDELRRMERRLDRLVPLVERACEASEEPPEALSEPLCIERVPVRDIIDRPDTARSYADRDEFLLFIPDGQGRFAEDEDAAYYSAPHEPMRGEEATRIEAGSTPYAFQGTLSAIRAHVEALQKAAPQPTFVRFDYCIPSPDQNHIYLCAVFVPPSAPQ